MAARKGMLREIAVVQTATIQWKEITVNTGASASTLQDIKVPESCGGYSYRDSSQPGSPLHNRFISWRTSGDTLELEESSLDLMLTGARIRYRFQDTPIVGGVSISEQQEHLVVLLATVASVHRFVFPHPSRRFHTDFSMLEHIETSVFYDASLTAASDVKNMHMINPGGSLAGHLLSAASCVSADGDAVFALGTAAGSILTLRMPPVGITGVVIQHELSQSSVIHKLWTGLVPGIIRGQHQNGDSVISVELQMLKGDIYIFALCRDLRLRVWAMKSRDCVLTVQLTDLLTDRPSAPPASSGHMMKKVQSLDKASLSYCVYMSFPDRSQFVLLEPVVEDNRLKIQLCASLTQPAEDLLDMCVADDQLITLWTDSHGDAIARAALLQQGEASSEWQELCLESPSVSQPLIPNNRDPREFFLDRIFRPNAFSHQDIVRALNVYSRSHDGNLSADVLLLSLNLREEVVNAVSLEIRNNAWDYEMTEVDFYQLQLEQWSRFYSCCCQYRQVGWKLRGVFTDSATGLVCLVRKAAVTYLRPCDLLERLYLCPSERLQPSDLQSLDFTVEGISSYAVCEDMHKLCNVLRLVQTSMTEELGAQFVMDLHMLKSPRDVAEGLVEELFFANNLAAEVASQIEIRLQAIRNLSSCLELISQLLNVQDMQDQQADMEDSMLGWQQESSTRHLMASPEGTAVLARVFEQMCLTRLTMLRDLVIVQVLALRLDQDQRKMEYQNIQQELLPHLCNLLQCYVVLNWSSQFLTCPTATSSVDSNMRRLLSLELRDNTGFQLVRQGPVSTTILDSFVQGVGGSAARRQLAGVIEAGHSTWSRELLTLVHSLAAMIWPVVEETLFPEFLAGSCQYMALQEYLRLVRSLTIDNQHTSLFLLALSYLYFDEPHKAARCFVAACEGVSTEPFLSHTVLHGCEGSQQEMSVLYYLKVIALFEHCAIPDMVIDLAQQAICLAQPHDPNLATLQSVVFKQQLELGHSHEAFTAMMANPDPARRKDCLRQLVVVLSERGELQALVEFDYRDLQDEVVKVLENRARSVDLMTHNYYHLLYAFHIHRNNLRQAASVMYEHGCRLGKELTRVRALQLQAQSYLVAMNALRLIQPENAWIVQPTSLTHKCSPSKHTLDGQDKATRGCQKAEIVDLKHLEKEYLLLDARLQFIRKQTDSALSSGPTPDADEMVGILVNNGLYDTAVVLCQKFGLQLYTVFNSLTQRCVSLARSSAMEKDNDTNAWDWLRENNICSSFLSLESSAVDQAWKMLEWYLKCFEETDARYHRCICEKLLSERFSLPSWLVNSYKVMSGPQLLRVYLDFDQLQAAAMLLVEYLEAVMAVLQGREAPTFALRGVTIQSPMAVWMPYTCVDQLLAALQRHQDDNAHKQLHKQLREKLNVYHGRLQQLCAPS